MKTVDLGQGAVPVAVALDLLFSLRQSLSLLVCAARGAIDVLAAEQP
jgi:hypothetical protein